MCRCRTFGRINSGQLGAVLGIGNQDVKSFEHALFAFVHETKVSPLGVLLLFADHFVESAQKPVVGSVGGSTRPQCSRRGRALREHVDHAVNGLDRRNALGPRLSSDEKARRLGRSEADLWQPTQILTKSVHPLCLRPRRVEYEDQRRTRRIEKCRCLCWICRRLSCDAVESKRVRTRVEQEWLMRRIFDERVHSRVGGEVRAFDQERVRQKPVGHSTAGHRPPGLAPVNQNRKAGIRHERIDRRAIARDVGATAFGAEDSHVQFVVY